MPTHLLAFCQRKLCTIMPINRVGECPTRGKAYCHRMYPARSVNAVPELHFWHGRGYGNSRNWVLNGWKRVGECPTRCEVWHPACAPPVVPMLFRLYRWGTGGDMVTKALTGEAPRGLRRQVNEEPAPGRCCFGAGGGECNRELVAGLDVSRWGLV